MPPQVSIIITIYNREKYIEQCVRSLMKQSLKSIEYIFIDDASTDNSLDILNRTLKEFPSRTTQTIIISLDNNQGVANARNIGLKYASGKYIIHADSDDWMDYDMYQQLLLVAQDKDADIVGCNICHEYEDYSTIHMQPFSQSTEKNISFLINGEIHPSLCTTLIKSEIIKENNITFLTNLNMGEDLLFNLKAYLRANKIEHINFAPYHYRHTTDSSSFNHSRKSIDSGIMIASKIEDLMKSEGLYKKYEKEITFRKFSMKYALINGFNSKENYNYWLNVFPETHKYIWSFKQINWKLRIMLYLSAKHLFPIAQFFNLILIEQNKIKNFIRKL